ncbi:uncharacterized protein L201_001125 [Kwoniella dendrophila CBS 6074]|uniref:Protein CPL1-like domain-containing protein n=1 Tax=Kwoniella dendrophila CBS 6074 TaxID=1295534 RepID=A0AAX4JLG1_9TREE
MFNFKATSIILIGLLFHLFLKVKAAVTYSSTFASCVTQSAYQPNGGYQPGTFTNSQACSQRCFSGGSQYIYSAWISTTFACYCGSNSFSTASVVAGNANGCGINFEVSITHTTFQFQQCTNNYRLTYYDLQSSSSDFYSIFQTANCRRSQYLAIWPTSGNTFLWACGNGYQSTGPTGNCGYQINRIYFHPPDATISNLAKRSKDDQKRRLSQHEQHISNNHWCPKGLTACQLQNDPTSFECIDTNSELESCGGCLHGDYHPPGYQNMTVSAGKDCSAVQGVARGHSSCIDGTCQFDCRTGWKYRDGQCVKS